MTTALIAGGDRGLGRAVAEELANRGMTVVVGARDEGAGALGRLHRQQRHRSLVIVGCTPQPARETALTARSTRTSCP